MLYILTGSVWEPQFLSILNNTWFAPFKNLFLTIIKEV